MSVGLMKPPASRYALQPRDQELVLSLYEEFREATLRDLCRRHCPDCRSQTPLNRALRRLLRAGLLKTKRVQLLGAPGRPALVYFLSRAAIPLIAQALSLSVDQVAKRVRQDGRLSDLFFSHRNLVTDVRLSLSASCALHGYTLVDWISDEEFRERKEQVMVRGKWAFVFPDAFAVVQAGSRTAPLFIEAQLRSKPVHFRRKIAVYSEYINSGRFSKSLGYTSIRILAIANTRARAGNIKGLVDMLPDAARYWSASIDDVRQDMLAAAVWLVGGLDGRRRLIE